VKYSIIIKTSDKMEAILARLHVSQLSILVILYYFNLHVHCTKRTVLYRHSPTTSTSIPAKMKLLEDFSQNAVTGPKLDDCLSYGFWKFAFFFYTDPDVGEQWQAGRFRDS